MSILPSGSRNRRQCAEPHGKAPLAGLRGVTASLGNPKEKAVQGRGVGLGQRNLNSFRV